MRKCRSSGGNGSLYISSFPSHPSWRKCFKQLCDTALIVDRHRRSKRQLALNVHTLKAIGMLFSPSGGMLSVVISNTTQGILQICWSTTARHTSEVNVATRPLRQTASIRPWYHSTTSNLAKMMLLQLSWNATAKLPRCNSRRPKDPFQIRRSHLYKTR